MCHHVLEHLSSLHAQAASWSTELMCGKLVTTEALRIFPCKLRTPFFGGGGGKGFPSLFLSFLSLIAQCNHPIALALKRMIYGILTLLVILLTLSLFYGGKPGDYNTPSFTYLIQTYF